MLFWICSIDSAAEATEVKLTRMIPPLSAIVFSRQTWGFILFWMVEVTALTLPSAWLLSSSAVA